MEKVEKKFVEYLYADFLFGDSITQEIDHNDPMKIELLDGAVAFRFFEREYILDNEKEYPGEIKNKSRWYFLGTKMSADEIKNKYKNDPNKYVLLTNIRSNKIKTMCMTPYGQFIPMKDEDITLSDYKILLSKKDEEKPKVKSLQKKSNEI